MRTIGVVKLYLSSYRIGRDRGALRDLTGPGRRAGVVMNACDVFDDRLAAWDREEADLRGLDFDVVEIDLRRHFGAPDTLATELAGLDLLWVVGGNTFALARAMDASGFAVAVADPLVSGRLTYAGYSAGVCVTTPGLEGVHLMDDPDVVPAGYPAGARPVALGWVPWRIVPHWSSDHPESDAADDAVQHLLHAQLPFRTLQDGRAVVVDGDVTRLV